MALVTLEPAPYRNAVVTKEGLMTPPWVRWHELSLVARVQQSAPTVLPQTRTATVSAAIPTTALVASAQGGVYRITRYGRITRPATTSSSLSVRVSALESGIVVGQDSPTVTSNTVDTIISGSVILAVDPGSPITYSTGYASVGATTMAYFFVFLVEFLG